jgi:hypothetical protein
VKVFVLTKTDPYDGGFEIVGVFTTLEVAKTIAEAEEPGKHFHWRDDMGESIFCLGSLSEGPREQYDIEEFEVRDK